jgi:glutathione S-transferase
MMADAMHAPVLTRFVTYDAQLNRMCATCCRIVQSGRPMVECTAAATAEPAELEELDLEF